ncbi:TonB-dependent siderophore receptor [uncultured Phascolarctobacterium sp.]|jgi:vitamin B12 transporter|uniref:TonB-dependent receptor plug domain-containing protein n=1 Tax=uncultured Phascolarctobacterium sp. TaxID=512296 RepID=UPI0026003633|nr:TonB-dependent receptor [uncultured Phascolarctobacterium sp.]
MTKKTILGMAVMCSLFATGSVLAAGTEQLDEYALPAMNVTALGYEKSNLETPADVTVYSGEELKKTGASDVANALKYKAGVYFTQMGPHDQSWITGNSTLSLRGVKGGTLILINGVPASFNNASHLDMVNLDTVEKVEVVKGGGAVLYGSEAYGGVINVITKDSYDNSIHVAAGNKGQRDYSANIGAGKLGLSFGRNEMGKTGILSEKIGTKNVFGTSIPYYMGYGDSKKDHIGVSYKFDDNLQFNYMFNKKKYTMDYLSANEEIVQHFMYDDREHFAQLHFDDKNGLEATAYYNERSIRNPDYWAVTPNVLEWERSNHKHYGADVKKVWENDNDKILVGFNTKRELYVNENQKFIYPTNNLKDYARFGAYALNGYSLYGQYDRKLSDATNMIFSMREDLVRSDAGNYDAFLPQLQVITNLDSENSLYANAGRSFRMPTFRQLYYSSGMIAANPDLKPEYGWNYEAGYKHDDGKEQVKVAVFHVDLDDQITSRKITVGGTKVSQSYNASKYRNTGVELSYSRKLSDELNWTVGGIYSNPQNKASDSAPWKDVLGKYQVMTSLDYQHDKTNASLNLSYMGGRVNNSKQTDVKPILVSNLHVGQEIFANATLTLDVNNIFDRRDYTDPDGLYYTQGRTFLVGMNYSF